MKRVWQRMVRQRMRIIDFLNNKVFSSPKNTVLFATLLVLAVVLIIQLYIIIFNNSIYNNRSDDILQYYMMSEGFIRSIKEGSLSFFDLNNYFGASFFSNLYYVPLDIFTLLSFLFSFIMPTVIAISTVELLKLVFGVFLLGTYFALKKVPAKIILYVSLLYFVSGGIVSFMNFPAFLSLVVYLPLGLLVIHYFLQQNYWVVPLFVFLIVLYNFYLAYMVLAFMSFAFLLEYFKYHEFRITSFLAKGASFLALMLLGVVLSSVILLPAITFISEQTIRTSVTFEPWVLDFRLFEVKLFPPEVYVRYFAKFYAPQRPPSFRGLLNDYKLEHVSNYITVFGLFGMSLIFFLKGKIARVYKIMIGIFIFAFIFPVFSSVLSGTIIMDMFSKTQEAFPYNRWINMMPLFFLMVLAHVIEEYPKQVKTKKPVFITSFFVGAVGVFAILFYAFRIFDSSLPLAVRQSLTVDWAFMMVGLSILVIGVVLMLRKNYAVLKHIMVFELLIAIGFMFSSGFTSVNRLSNFQEMYQINAFLNAHINEDDFTRVYVDIDEFGVIDRNFNQITTYPTNSVIFHSWPDAQTDDLTFLMFPNQHIETERQLKNKMNYYSYYLSSFLGYKYILIPNKQENLADIEGITVVATSDAFILLKIAEADSFYVYDHYLTYRDFKLLNPNIYPQVAREHLFLQSVLLDQEDYEIETLGLKEFDLADANFMARRGTVTSYRIISQPTVVQREVDGESKNYYAYINPRVDYESGSVYLKDYSNGVDYYQDIYYTNHLQEELACSVSGTENYTLIRCGDFTNGLDAIYVAQTEDFSYPPTLSIRYEEIVDNVRYITFPLNQIQNSVLPSIFNVSFANHPLTRSFIVDLQGQTHYPIADMYEHVENAQKLYVYKSQALQNHNDLFLLLLQYSIYTPDMKAAKALQPDVYFKQMQIDNGEISLSYVYLAPTESAHMIVIPVTYSDQWEIIQGGDYQTMAVSGGFLGVLVPEGTQEVDIRLRFMPKNFSQGTQISLIALPIYLGVIGIEILIKNKKGRKEYEES